MRISIRYQILALLVGVTALALAAFLALAVQLFTRDQLAYVYELEMSLTTTMAEEVRVNLEGIGDRLGYFAAQSSVLPEEAADALLATDPDMLSIEVWRRESGTFTRTLQRSDPDRLAQLNLSADELAEARRTTPVPFAAVEIEGPLLQNASLPPDVALLSLAAAPHGTDLVVVALFRPDRLLRIFGRSPGYRAFLVDGKGGVIVDPDPERVVARESAESVPVVREAVRGALARAVREFEGEQGPVIGAFARVGVGRLAVIAEIPRSEALGATRALERRSALFAAAILFLAVIASVALGRRLTAPLRRLEAATRAVAQGDVATPVEVTGRNEIGSLAESFNRMVQAVADREARLSEAHQELMQAERLSVLGEIAAGVVHDVKNPLSAIAGYASIAQDSESKEEVQECLTTIEQAAWRARDIVEGILQFARREEVELASVPVNDVVEDTLRMLKYQIYSGSVAVERDLDPRLPEVRANRGQLQQVLVNLVINATHAMESREQRRLTVRSTVRDRHVVIEVGDTGSGIPPETLARLFQPFFTTKVRGKGTGLGLSVSQRIVRGFGGEIAITSTVGQGSTFTVRIPTEGAAGPDVAAADGPGPLSGASTGG